MTVTQNQRSFVHLLGYRPEIVSRELLDRLLKSRLAADEMAVAQSLGLYFHHKSWRKKSLEQAEAQSQFEIWKKAMEGEWSLKPSLVDLKRLCVAALGLHLNGSTEALELIEKAGKRDGIQRFDEPLQLIRTARLASSPLESPLAFLIPAEAATMAAVLEELTSGEMRFRATVVESLAPVREPQPQPQPKRAPVSQVWGWWCAIALGLVGLFCYRRYSKR